MIEPATAPAGVRLRARLLGHPMTYGNKRAFVVKPKGGGKPIAVLANRDPVNLKAWQDAFRQKMIEAKLNSTAPPVPLDCAFTVMISFHLARPQSHFRSVDGHPSAQLKASAPPYPTKAPDNDKVARAVLDCMTGIWCRDDACVVDLMVMKRWARPGEPEWTMVTCEPMAEDVV